ncbi:electron transfer flavoprotein subunit alpha/FixB family protein [Paenibacillus woosongensis]|uniref:Electron transfer flavoprotein subunit alpha/FixB family protein n=1 Tax=Paenibacillus woosongensis TaxID=307580 RepID=A0AA95I8L9_9BACL|nr:electron transfer flavoprotein subunit alpha/FixB family protein [Paenibacillus woosongensis]WHX51276.1 electron transfer flavoprotein subunit alpha/FixB family protein [Paenibacillus woosongensis]
MSKHYVVIAEVRSEQLRQVSLEAIEAARLSAHEGDTISALLLGHNLSEQVSQLSRYVSGQVHVLDHPDLEHYLAERYCSAIIPVLESLEPYAIVLGHTAMGRDLAPMLAAHFQAGQISDVTAIHRNGSELLFTRPVYAGKAFEQKRFIDGRHIITVRPNNIPPAAEAGSPGEIVQHAYTAPVNLRTIIKDVITKASGRVDLAEAQIVVSGGRGVKSAEGFKPLEQLAEVLGGAVGASRGACDAGYCDYALQIGQTGKVVTPQIYIACGISGAIQHLAGMSQSRIIIAINKDPEAPIFKIADYGIVGDLFEVVPLLTEEFRKALA